MDAKTQRKIRRRTPLRDWILAAAHRDGVAMSLREASQLSHSMRGADGESIEFEPEKDEQGNPCGDGFRVKYSLAKTSMWTGDSWLSID